MVLLYYNNTFYEFNCIHFLIVVFTLFLSFL